MESVPSEKDALAVIEAENAAIGDRHNLGFMSTLSTYGRGIGVATGTGMDTEIGKIATMLEETESDETPLQKKLADFGKKTRYSHSLFVCFYVCLLRRPRVHS